MDQRDRIRQLGPATVTRRAGVLGHPIGHSLSPVLHRAAYAALGLDWRYDAYDVTAEDLGDFLSRLDDSWAGLSLTMPLKVEALRHLDAVEPLAASLGAVNTVLPQPSTAGGHLVGANTDVHGVVAALAEAGVEAIGSAVIFGGGATATSAMAAVASLGCAEPTVAVRSRSRAGGLVRAAARIGASPRLVLLGDGARAAASAEAVISTIPTEAGAEIGAAVTTVAPGAVLLDAVYAPPVTPLAEAWESAGGVAVSGLRMLLHQAAEQVRLMTGQAPPIDEMDAALVSHLSH